MLSLTIETRDMKISPEKVRAAGSMPAVYYGPKEASTSISVNAKEFGKVWKKAGESSVVILKDAAGAEHETLIHEVDVHPLTGTPRHADFYVIEKGKKVQVSVPLVFTGVSSAVKDKAGILVKVQRELEIEAAPRDLPHDITVDISRLVELTDVIKAGDLTLSPGVVLMISADEIIASISVPKEEVEEAPTAIDMSAIEVEKKGKAEVEGEAGAAPAAEGKSSEKKK